MMKEERFTYKPKVFIALFGMIFFGAAAYFTAGLALEVDKGLNIYPIIELSVGSTIIFYWTLAVVFAIFTLFKIALILVNITTNNELILNENYIQIPKGGMSRKMIRVEFANIHDITLQKVQVNLFLTLFHDEGELTILSSLLPQEEDFKHIAYYVIERANCEPLIKPSM
jgi:hypothetical protein